MEGLDKGGQGPILGCCTIEEEYTWNTVRGRVADTIKSVTL
jgi:hypothetical protein